VENVTINLTSRASLYPGLASFQTINYLRATGLTTTAPEKAPKVGRNFAD